MSDIVPGSTRTLYVQWSDASGYAAPSLCKLYLRSSGGSQTIYTSSTITNPTTGRFEQEVDFALMRSVARVWDGHWYSEWADGKTASVKFSFTIQDSPALS